MRYVRIRSWHVATGVVSRAGRTLTRCGRSAPVGAPEADSFGDEKTCETCLRLAAGDAEATEK